MSEMTVCCLCRTKVWTERLLEHWQRFCPREPQSELAQVMWYQIGRIVEAAYGYNTIDSRDGGRNDR
jgi:hypothetical protein